MNRTGDPDWGEDEDPGTLIRPFVVTRGRAGTGLHDLDLITLVTSVCSDRVAGDLDREYAQIVRLCRGRPLSIAEISAHLGLLVVTVKVLVSDLVQSGHVIFRTPAAVTGGPDPIILQAVLDGIRRI